MMPTPRRPWFRRRPTLTIVVAVSLFVAIFALRLLVPGPSQPILQLFVLPIALLAMAFGRRSGITAALVGVIAVVAWALIADLSFNALDWAGRTVPMLLLGALVGDASDRLRVAATTRLRLDRARLMRREAAEINDTIVQHLAVAKWMLENGDKGPGLGEVQHALTMAQELVGEMLSDADLQADGADRLPDVRHSLHPA